MRVYSRNAAGIAAITVACITSALTARAGTILDCDTNGLLDTAEISQRAELDLNTNGRIDDCERMTGGICPEKVDLDGEQEEPIDPLRPRFPLIWDQDGDGVEDCPDQCPYDPAKTQPGACGCGFRDDDTDGDEVADCIDNCPQTFNPDQSDADSNGVGDACQLAIVCPADITVTADESGGAHVVYQLAGMDHATGAVTVAADPPSGAWFPIGASVVTYEVSDEADQRAVCQFLVFVSAPDQGGSDLDTNGGDADTNTNSGGQGTSGDQSVNGDGTMNGGMGGGVTSGDGDQTGGDGNPPAGQLGAGDDCVMNRDMLRLGVMLAYRAPVCGIGCLTAVPFAVMGCVGLRCRGNRRPPRRERRDHNNRRPCN